MGGVQTLKLESNRFYGIPRTVPLEVAARGGHPVRPNANTSLSIQRLDDILMHTCTQGGGRERARMQITHRRDHESPRQLWSSCSLIFQSSLRVGRQKLTLRHPPSFRRSQWYTSKVPRVLCVHLPCLRHCITQSIWFIEAVMNERLAMNAASLAAPLSVSFISPSIPSSLARLYPSLYCSN